MFMVLHDVNTTLRSRDGGDAGKGGIFVAGGGWTDQWSVSHWMPVRQRGADDSSARSSGHPWRSEPESSLGGLDSTEDKPEPSSEKFDSTEDKAQHFSGGLVSTEDGAEHSSGGSGLTGDEPEPSSKKSNSTEDEPEPSSGAWSQPWSSDASRAA